jgi:hypothetical protein
MANIVSVTLPSDLARILDPALPLHPGISCIARNISLGSRPAKCNERHSTRKALVGLAGSSLVEQSGIEPESIRAPIPSSLHA